MKGIYNSKQDSWWKSCEKFGKMFFFGFVEHQENSTLGIGCIKTMKRNKITDQSRTTPAVNGEVDKEGNIWYEPLYTSNEIQKHLMKIHHATKTSAEISYTKRFFFSNLLH